MLQTEPRQEALQLSICEVPIVPSVEQLKRLLELRCGERKNWNANLTQTMSEPTKQLGKWVPPRKKNAKTIKMQKIPRI